MMPPWQNLDVYENHFTKSFLKYFLWFLLHLKRLKINNL